MTIGQNLFDGPPPTLLPEDPAAAELAAGADPDAVVRAHPTSSLAWAVLADQAWADGRVVESYAFARVGYHRGPGLAAPQRLEGPRPGAVEPRAEPGLPALPALPRSRRRGHRRAGRGRPHRRLHRRLRPVRPARLMTADAATRSSSAAASAGSPAPPSLAGRGVDVALLDRGRRLAGRMASRTLRGHRARRPTAGSSTSARPTSRPPIPASSPWWATLVDRGVVRPWTDSFHVAGPAGIEGVRSGPMRYAAPGGLRSVVEALAAAVPGLRRPPVARGRRRHGGPPDVVAVDGEPAEARSRSACRTRRPSRIAEGLPESHAHLGAGDRGHLRVRSAVLGRARRRLRERRPRPHVDRGRRQPSW